MGRLRRAEGRTSARTLIFLAALYAIAAGMHGVLAVLFTTLWHAALAAVLTPVAIGCLVLAARARRRRPPPAEPSPVTEAVPAVRTAPVP